MKKKTLSFENQFRVLMFFYGLERNRSKLFKNCVFAPINHAIDEDNKSNINYLPIFTGKNSGKHNFGYTCYMPKNIIIDGLYCPEINDMKMHAIVKGDSKYDEISAASIIAKFERDQFMLELDKKFPKYQFMGIVYIPKGLKKKILDKYDKVKNNKKLHTTNFLDYLIKHSSILFPSKLRF